jgi:hypothetical protein
VQGTGVDTRSTARGARSTAAAAEKRRGIDLLSGQPASLRDTKTNRELSETELSRKSDFHVLFNEVPFALHNGSQPYLLTRITGRGFATGVGG